MTIRRKTFLARFVFFLLMVTVIYLTTHLLLDRNIDNLESRTVGQQMALVQNAFESQIDNLSAVCLDEAARDDSYAFMADHNAQYIASNLQDTTYETLRLNLVVYADTQGDAVFSRGYDLVSRRDTPLPANLMTELKNQGVPFATTGAGASARGVIMLDGRPMMVAAHPIVDSQGQGPPRGTLIVGRYIDDQVVAGIGKMDSMPLVLYPYAGGTGPSVIREARGAVAGGASSYLTGIDAENYAGVIALDNPEGRPVLLVEATFDRSLFAPIRSFGFYLMLGLLLMATLGIVGTFFFMDRWGLRRLALFSREVQRVGRSSDPNERVRVTGHDEISLVAESVNATLDALRQARDALESSAEQYRDLFDNASDMIQSVDQAGRFVYTNPAWRETLGYRREEVAALKLRDVIHPDDLEEHLGLFRRALAGERIESTEIAFVTRDGKKVTVIGSIGCRFVGASPAYTRGIFHDISELKEAREARQEMYETEKGLRQSLQEAIAKRIEFSRMVAHELKNSLTVLMVSSEMLEDNPGSDQVTLLSQNIHRSAEHLQSRINEMLDMARIEMGTLHIHPERLNPAPVLREMADYIQPIAGKRGQTVRLEAPERLPGIVADRDRLCQILINLLGNASRYTPAGGRITLGAEALPRFLRFFVQDTGRGIEEKEQRHIFEPYYRPERDRDRISGLGLGLALCKMLVEKHGGRIDVTSQVGQGTTFAFTIPLHEKDIPRDEGVV